MHAPAVRVLPTPALWPARSVTLLRETYRITYGTKYNPSDATQDGLIRAAKADDPSRHLQKHNTTLVSTLKCVEQTAVLTERSRSETVREDPMM